MQICSQCNRDVPDNVKFCPSCGTKIEQTDAQAPTQQPTPQYTQPTPQYAQPAPQYAQPAPQYTTQPPTEQSGVLSTIAWIGVLILGAIPVVGLIVYIIWAFANLNNKNLRNFARAILILWIITFVSALIAGIIFWTVIASFMDLYKY